MVIKGYLVYNITQNTPKFIKQLNTWVEAFKAKKMNLKLVNNFEAFNTIKNEKKKPDFVFFYDKDIALMYELLALNIPLFTNVDAVRLCDDKAYIYAHLIKNKISTPKTIILPLVFFIDITKYFDKIKDLIAQEGITYPLLVKERRSSFGYGVFLIKNAIELKSKLKEIGYREVLIQEYIGFEKGKDYRVYLINHRPKIVVTRINKADYRSNVELGGKMSLIKEPDEELLKLAMRTSIALNMDFGAIDLVKDENNKYYVLEANSNARTMNLDKLADASISKAVAKYILENI